MRHLGKTECALALLIAALTAGIIVYKVYVLGYSMATIHPESGYHVQLLLEAEGTGGDVRLETTLPSLNERQRILHERHSAGAFQYSVNRSRRAVWLARRVTGSQQITYSFFAQTEARSYPLPEGALIVTNASRAAQEHLAPTALIQSDDPEIQARARELIPEGVDLTRALQNVYNFVHQEITYRTVRGPTDARAALRLREASCNGKSRLMVALLRARGIPARMAQGLILESIRKRTTHAWAEALVGDKWVPFCASNGHFASLPENYLELGKGDEALFSHTKHIRFDWRWVVQQQLTHSQQAVWSSANHPLNILRYWVSLKEFHIPLDLIMIILMVPIAATVICIARNVVGLLPFGTFMPALIAVSFQETGFWLGSVLLLVVVLGSFLLNLGLVRLRLLHIPRLVIILTFVVISMMAVSIASVKLGLARGAGVSLFPMAILSLTSERFTQTILEDGVPEAARRMAVTYLVAAACFSVISLENVQMVVAAFPELLLLNIAINLVVGSWSGLRLLEYARFRLALTPEPALPEP